MKYFYLLGAFVWLFVAGSYVIAADWKSAITIGILSALHLEVFVLRGRLGE